MKRNRSIKIALLAICGIIAGGVFTSCKPTEKNYQAAYDAAKAKREAAEAEQMIPATGLLSDDGPRLRIVDGDSLYVSHDRIRVKSMKAAGIEVDNYSVGVSVYKMSTNAKAAATRLKEAGYNAVAVETTGDRWYTVAGTFPTLNAASEFIKAFKERNPKYPYIGLPGSPVIVAK